jgi:hypothetical protein
VTEPEPEREGEGDSEGEPDPVTMPAEAVTLEEPLARSLRVKEGEPVSREEGDTLTEGDPLTSGDLVEVGDAVVESEEEAEAAGLCETPPVIVPDMEAQLVMVAEEDPEPPMEAVAAPLSVVTEEGEELADSESAVVVLADGVNDVKPLRVGALEAEAGTVSDGCAVPVGTTVGLTLAVADAESRALPEGAEEPVTDGICVVLMVLLLCTLKVPVLQGQAEGELDARVDTDGEPLPVPRPSRAVPVVLCVMVTSEVPDTVDVFEGGGERVEESQADTEGEAEGLCELEGERESRELPEPARVAVPPFEAVPVRRGEVDSEGFEEALTE